MNQRLISVQVGRTQAKLIVMLLMLSLRYLLRLIGFLKGFEINLLLHVSLRYCFGFSRSIDYACDPDGFQGLILWHQVRFGRSQQFLILQVGRRSF